MSAWYWLIADNVPVTFLGAEGLAVNKTEQGPAPHVAYISMEKIECV